NQAVTFQRMQQSLHRRPHQEIEKVVSFRHALIPERCIGVPRPLCFHVLIVILGHVLVSALCYITSKRSGRFQSAERAMPTLQSLVSSTNLLSASHVRTRGG